MSTLITRRWDPFAEIDTVVRTAFPAAFPGTFPAALVRTRRPLGPSGFVPAAEVVRDGADALVRLELPGLDPERDVTVEVERATLVVRGERRDERADEKAGRTVREVRYGSFRRTFALPAQVGAEQVSASYDAGVLTVRVAGAYAGTEARRVEVTSGRPAAPAAKGEGEGGEQAA